MQWEASQGLDSPSSVQGTVGHQYCRQQPVMLNAARMDGIVVGLGVPVCQACTPQSALG